MSPKSITDLPLELQLAIGKHLWRRHAFRLLRVCKALRPLGEALIYTTARVLERRASLLARTLLERPAFGYLVRDLDLHICASGGRSVDVGPSVFLPSTLSGPEMLPDRYLYPPWDALRASLMHWAATHGMSDMAESWYQAVRAGNHDAWCAFFVSLMPNLTRVNVAGQWAMQDYWFLSHVALKHGGITDVKIGSKLIGPPEKDEPGRRTNTLDALRFLYLDKMTHFEATIDNPLTTFSWPLPNPPAASSIVVLNITHLREQFLLPILTELGRFGRLRILRYYWEYWAGFDKEVSSDVVDLDVLAAAVVQCKDSLQRVYIDGDRFPDIENGGFHEPVVSTRGSLEGLSQMHRLEWLAVSWAFVVSFLPGRRYRPGRIAAVVPPGLKRLTLTSELSCRTEDPQPETVAVRDDLCSEFDRGEMRGRDALELIELPGAWEYRDPPPELPGQLESLSRHIGVTVKQQSGWDMEGLDIVSEPLFPVEPSERPQQNSLAEDVDWTDSDSDEDVEETE